MLRDWWRVPEWRRDVAGRDDCLSVCGAALSRALSILFKYNWKSSLSPLPIANVLILEISWGVE